MRLHWKKQFDGDYTKLETSEIIPGSVKYKEPEGKRLPWVVNGITLAISLTLVVLWGFLIDDITEVSEFAWLGVFILSLVVIIPHELLHAICFKEDVYMYTWFSKGMAFVCGPEMFSKSRFVFMSLLPNILFGFIPFIMFLFCRDWEFLGLWGALGIGMGAGDYLNVFNTLTQVPRGAKTYMHQMNSYWITQQDLDNYNQSKAKEEGLADNSTEVQP